MLEFLSQFGPLLGRGKETEGGKENESGRAKVREWCKIEERDIERGQRVSKKRGEGG